MSLPVLMEVVAGDDDRERQWRGELGAVEGGEIVVRMCCMREE